MSETNEIWKDVPGFENLYQVSSIGRIRSKDKMIIHRGFPMKRFGHVLSPHIFKNGYNNMVFCIAGVLYRFSIHRLVAMAFIRMPQAKEVINHKNGIKNDNRVENLEWCTTSENIKHAYATGLAIAKSHPKPKLGDSPFAKKIIGTHIVTGEQILFGSISEARAFLGVTHGGNIHAVLTGRIKYTKNYHFKRV